MATELPTVSEPERFERCETCKWWVYACPLTADGFYHIDEPSGETYTVREFEDNYCEPTGVCHRYPPTRRDSMTSSFPNVWSNDFCGEWRAK